MHVFINLNIIRLYFENGDFKSSTIISLTIISKVIVFFLIVYTHIYNKNWVISTRVDDFPKKKNTKKFVVQKILFWVKNTCFWIIKFLRPFHYTVNLRLLLFFFFSCNAKLRNVCLGLLKMFLKPKPKIWNSNNAIILKYFDLCQSF